MTSSLIYPQQVLGLSRGATQTEIKAAYRRLALKHHPDRVRGDGPDGGVDAKKQATALFAEISAAYELLTKNSDTAGNMGSSPCEGGSASHPSFTSPDLNSTHRHHAGGNGSSQFYQGFDPFGFSAFGNVQFTDPFELFQRTFGDFPQPIHESSFYATNTNTNTRMGMPPFGGFPSLFSPMMNIGFPTDVHASSMAAGAPNFGNFITSTYSSSYQHGSTNGGNVSKMVSTTTSIVNGKAVTRREEIVVNPDGTKTTTVDLTGDAGEDRMGLGTQRPAIKAVNRSEEIRFQSVDKTGTKSSTMVESSPKLMTRDKESTKRQSAAPVTRKSRSKQCKNEANQSRMNQLPSQIEPNTTFSSPAIKTLKNKISPQFSHKGKNNCVTPDQSNGRKISKTSAVVNKPIADSVCKDNATGNANTCSSTAHPRKRKFCEVMSRCFLCCFPKCKRRRTTGNEDIGGTNNIDN